MDTITKFRRPVPTGLIWAVMFVGLAAGAFAATAATATVLARVEPVCSLDIAPEPVGEFAALYDKS